MWRLSSAQSEAVLGFDERGSLWRTWDLHFHTPRSYDYKKKSVTNTEIIKGLKSANISAVAVTDHHVIDVQLIKDLQNLASNELTILPGIELRTELGGKEKVHLIGIFSEDSDLDEIWTKLSGQLSITAADVKRKRDDAIYVDFRRAADLIHQLGGVVTTHAGGKSNSIEAIGNNEKFKMALKADLARDCVDIYEVGKSSDCEGYAKVVFPAIGKTLPIIMGSDNHDITNYSQKEKCWIKGDPSFRTFQQLISAPERAFLGDKPPELLRVETNPTKYVSEIKFAKKPGSRLEEEWFSGTVKLNPGLIAIIGNKGNGKTALAETIGLLGNCRSSEAFSFLSDKKFRRHRNNKAREFEATLMWRNGRKVTLSLNDVTDKSRPAQVSYIPQNYLELICNEVNSELEVTFDKELKSVIFSHVPDSRRLNAESLDELLDFQIEPFQKHLTQLRSELSDLNQSILELQHRGSTENKQKLLALKQSKQGEIEAHEKLRPKEILKPETDPSQQTAMNLASKKIERLNQEREILNKAIRQSESAQGVDAVKRASASRVLQHLANFKSVYKTLLENLESDCKVLQTKPESLVKIEINEKPVRTEDGIAKADFAAQEAFIDAQAPRLGEIKSEIDKLTAELDAPNSAYQKYIEALREWTEKRKSLIGTAQKRDTLKFIEQQIEDLKAIPDKVKEATKARSEKVKEIYSDIEKIVGTYRTLYHPVQEFILLNPVAKGKLKLKFDANVMPDDLERTILGGINQAKRGTFAGVEEGQRVLKHLADGADFQTSSGVLAFAEALVQRFESDYRQEKPTRLKIEDQLKVGETPLKLLDTIFGLTYLSPKYELKWSDKTLEELSPGERGTLLLIFYLLIDRRDVPLIIDQPEDNLDNQTVYELLVACLREARQRRQVIIVTHNPNLAVACDADQIVHSHIDKQHKNTVTYTSGSLENPQTNAMTIAILEGTRPALDQRNSKYHPAN